MWWDMFIHENICFRTWIMLLHAVIYQQLHKKMLLQSPLIYELYHIDYSYKIEILYVYSKIVNRTWIIGIFMIIKWIYRLFEIKTGCWFDIFCIFFNFLLDNSLGQLPCWTISCAMFDDLGSLDQWSSGRTLRSG